MSLILYYSYNILLSLILLLSHIIFYCPKYYIISYNICGKLDIIPPCIIFYIVYLRELNIIPPCIISYNMIFYSRSLSSLVIDLSGLEYIEPRDRLISPLAMLNSINQSAFSEPAPCSPWSRMYCSSRINWWFSLAGSRLISSSREFPKSLPISIWYVQPWLD